MNDMTGAGWIALGKGNSARLWTARPWMLTRVAGSNSFGDPVASPLTQLGGLCSRQRKPSDRVDA